MNGNNENNAAGPDEADDPWEDAGLDVGDDDAGGTPGIRDILRMAEHARAEAQASAPPEAAQVTPPEAVPKDDSKKPSPFDENVLAVNLAPDPSSPGRNGMLPVATWELHPRRQLAGAMMGVGGPLHHLTGRSALSAIDVQAGQGIVFGLSSGTDDPVTRLQAYAAAGMYVALSRAAGRLSEVAEERRAGSGKDLHDIARAMTTLERGFRRSLEGVEAARARDRQRNAIPEFRVIPLAAAAKAGAGK